MDAANANDYLMATFMHTPKAKYISFGTEIQLQSDEATRLAKQATSGNDAISTPRN
jgi:hypothetical protein